MTGPRATQPVLILTEHALAVRSALEPTAWVVLEQLALRAVHIDGQAVAEESARTLAEAVGRSKDAVTRALRQLADAGLVERGESRHAFSGRFSAGHYVVDLRASGLRLPTETVDTPGVDALPKPPSRAVREQHLGHPPVAVEPSDRRSTRLF